MSSWCSVPVESRHLPIKIATRVSTIQLVDAWIYCNSKWEDPVFVSKISKLEDGTSQNCTQESQSWNRQDCTAAGRLNKLLQFRSSLRMPAKPAIFGFLNFFLVVVNSTAVQYRSENTCSAGVCAHVSNQNHKMQRVPTLEIARKVCWKDIPLWNLFWFAEPQVCSCHTSCEIWTLNSLTLIEKKTL